jgi:SAM-dependent methyltransferase
MTVSPFYEEERPAEPLWQVGGFSIVRCKDSGLVYVANPLPEGELAAFYSVEYFEGESGRKGYASYRQDEPVLRANFRDLVRRLAGDAARAGLDPGTLDLLDWGCAYGYFLDEARRSFGRVCGVEINEGVAEIARSRLGLDVRSGPSASRSFSAGSFDVITLWDVIEHVSRPRATLLEVARLLRPGGSLYLTTGDIGSPLARLLGRRWRLVNPPQHVTYFSQRTLTGLLSACGLETLAVERVGKRVSLRLFLFILSYLTGRTGAAQSARLARLADRSVHLNLFDVMLVRARKRPDLP